MRRLFVFLTALLLGCATGSGADEAAGSRRVLSWDQDWLFSRTDPATAMSPGFDDQSWRRVRVPHDWSQDEPFRADFGSGNGYAAGGVAWYRKHFRVDPAARGQRVAVEFDGVYDHAEVWINGHFAGGRPYGYSSFEVDLTGRVSLDGDNVLAVRVDHSRFADSRFYTGSGIYRHVRLRLTNPLHVATWGTFVTSQIVGARATVSVATDIANETQEARTFVLRTELVGPDGAVAATQSTEKKAAAGETVNVAQSLVVERPQLWSTERPALYVARQRILFADTPVDEIRTTFGLRSIAYDPDHGFSLNGRPVKLKGVCIHHDAGSLGAAVPDQVLERRLRLLRELGVNAIRTSHNPPAPELLELCDRLGFLVMDEAFDEFTPTKKKWVAGWNAGEPSRYGYGEEFAEWSVRDMEDLVRRDRNHPCIVMWSIGNEIDYPNDPFSDPALGDSYHPQNPPATDLVKHGAPLVAAVKRLDRTRPVTAALASVAMSNAAGFADILDLAGYNYQELRYASDHAQFPRRVIYGSENRHDYAAWVAVRDNDYICGQFLWTGIDYLGEAGRWPVRANGAGLLDLCGFKKPLAWFRQSLWSETPMVYLCAERQIDDSARGPIQTQGQPALDRTRRGRLQEHWNWPNGSTLTVTCYSNCAEVELRLNGRSLGVKRAADAVEGALTWTVPYEPGELRAVGSKEGKTASEFALKTAGPAARVELISDRATLNADGDAIAHVEYRIVDANGVRVPDAAVPVAFEIAGPATLLGIGNGDLRNSEDPHAPTHQSFQGRGLAVLQSQRTAGAIIIRAKATELAPAEITLQSEPAP